MKLGLLLALMLFMGQLCAASSQRINKECAVQASWAGEIFDIVTENPEVQINSMDPADLNNVAFIRKWIGEHRSRDDLLAYVWSHCPDSV